MFSLFHGFLTSISKTGKLVSVSYLLSLEKPCSGTLLVYLFIRFACIGYGRFIVICYNFKL